VPAEELAEVARKHLDDVSVEVNVSAALDMARSFNPEAIVVAGSISLAGDVLKSIQLDDDYEDDSTDRKSEDGE
jgi:folylpolyglutamate synthase/dihydropteroate synthase